jgi:hypothetical protein
VGWEWGSGCGRRVPGESSENSRRVVAEQSQNSRRIVGEQSQNSRRSQACRRGFGRDLQGTRQPNCRCAVAWLGFLRLSSASHPGAELPVCWLRSPTETGRLPWRRQPQEHALHVDPSPRVDRQTFINVLYVVSGSGTPQLRGSNGHLRKQGPAL